MGVTIESKNFSLDMGFGGFNLFREKVAELSGEIFKKHYKDLDKAFLFVGKSKEEFFKTYNAKTTELIEANHITVEIANFCYQADCGGFIDQRQAKQIYEKIKGHDDDVCYGYAGRPDCAMFSDLKNLFKDCMENGDAIEWW